MILTVNHETVYRYEGSVAHSTQYLRLTPQSTEGQRVLEWKLELPSPAVSSSDAFGNICHVLTLDMPHREIRIRAMGIVETDDGERTSVSGGDPLPYLRSTPLTAISPDLAAFAEGFRKQPMAQEDLLALAQGIEMAVEFSPGSTHVGSTAADAFAAGLGVCQDHTHIFLSCCRYLGVPARYVSGYVHSPGHASNHMATHAWAEAWLHDRWWSFDVVNRSRADENHLKLAVGMDYLDACPVRGVRRGGGGELMQADVRVMQSQAGTNEAEQEQDISQQQQQQQQA